MKGGRSVDTIRGDRTNFDDVAVYDGRRRYQSPQLDEYVGVLPTNQRLFETGFEVGTCAGHEMKPRALEPPGLQSVGDGRGEPGFECKAD